MTGVTSSSQGQEACQKMKSLDFLRVHQIKGKERHS